MPGHAGISHNNNTRNFTHKSENNNKKAKDASLTKKARAQQRRKAGKHDDEAFLTEAAGGDAEFLSEEHTIADSMDTDLSGAGGGAGFDDDWRSGDADTDDYLAHAGARPGESTMASDAARLVRLQDALSVLEELPSEKRSAKREAHLKKVFKALTQYVTSPTAVETVEECEPHIRSACLYCIRSGQPSEQYAACRVLEAASVILGGDMEDWVESIDKTLRLTVMATSRAVPVRMAALRALSMAVFIGSDDSAVAEEFMDLCEAVAAVEYRNEIVPALLRATALDCWALQATTVEDLYLAGQDDVQTGRGLAMLNLLKGCLESGSADLRCSAGECLALIHEARLNLGIMADNDAAAPETMNTTERKFSKGTWEGTDYEVVMDEVKQLVAELAVQTGHHMSKKDKKEQRATFREFMATIVDDEAPEEVVTFRNGDLSLTTWKEIVQLNCVRHCLQGGFQIQLMTNATLQAIFGASSELHSYGGGMTQLEKRLLLSKTSEAAKDADRKLAQQRDKRQNIKNHFLTADGDDV